MRWRLELFSTLFVALCGAAACSSDSSDAGKSCSQQTSALRTCAGSSVLHGIDVSTYQAAIAWTQVKSAGIDFAFARISDGTIHPDAQFASNWREMKAAGVVRGSYQYFRAGQDPMSQVTLLVSALSGAGGLQSGDLPVVMDIETADGQPNATVQAHMATWLHAVAMATGRTPIIYANVAATSIIGPGFANYTLWVANWGTTCPALPSGWSTWKFWQYSDRGAISGVAGPVDLDEFDGTLADLLSFAKAASGDAGAAAGSAPDAGSGGPGRDGAGAASSEGGAAMGYGVDAGLGPPTPTAGLAGVDGGAAMGLGADDASSAGPCSPALPRSM
jgi:lysozyme